VFNTATGTTFPSDYQQLLQTVFDSTQAELTAKFGPPRVSGSILVSNYDSTIDDRDAVAGGIYLPDNGSGQQEIRFPVYNANEAAAVNFIHTLLLAYQGTTPYAYDAFEEGLVRGVTAMIAREHLVSGLLPSTIESVLSSTYDVLGNYDWDNQRGLGGPRFIAPNLISQTIGSATNGGLYLLRYRMSGSAWSKVLTEYPTFAKDLNAIVAATPSLTSNVPGLIAAAQTVLNADNPTNPTVEGLSFSDWAARQFILQTTLTAGTKVVVEAVAEDPDPSATVVPDFGLFDIETTYFSTDSSGNETLLTPLNSVAYPIYQDYSFNRFSPSADADFIPMSVGYGSVTPNFLSSYNGGQIYRVAVDVPVSDQVARVYLPAGAVSTSNNTTTNDVYGTVSGADPASGQTLDVKVYVGTDLVTDAPVVSGAFGVNVASVYEAEYSIARKIEVQVWSTSGTTSTMILDRFVDKPATGTLADSSQVGLGLDLRVNAETSYRIPIAAGLNAIGFPVDPFASDSASVLGSSSSQILVGRYDGITGKFLLNPSVEPFKIGHGYFVQSPTALAANYQGRTFGNAPTGVALGPGWNLISCPLTTTETGSQVLVYHAADLSTPSSFTDAASAGLLLGNTFFSFVTGPADPVAGYPTTGSFTAATQFVPGQAYYVQCLAPEGLTLEFLPGSSSAIKRGVKLQATTTPPAWQVHVDLSGSSGDFSDCVVGMARGATTGFDRTYDSGVPPSIGGLQLTSQNGQPLYRDFRAVASSVSYTLVASNLKVGKSYTMNLLAQAGYAPRVTLRNESNHVTSVIPRNGRSYFVATSTTQTFTLTAIGVGN
jgi:hypothetical protein